MTGAVNELVSLLVLLLFLGPFLWMVVMSFQTRTQIFARPPLIWFRPTLANYTDLMNRGVFLDYLQNSLVVVVLTVLVSLAFAIPAAYGFARFRFRRREDLAFWVLSIRMAPPIAVVIPYFLIGSFLGILDTRFVLVVAYLSFNIPFAIWMIRGFIEDVPVEVEEAAQIDGCSRFQALRRVTLPLVGGGIAATAILLVIQSWNEFAFALFLTTTEARTLPTIVTQFLTFQGVVWGEMAAAASITVIPIVIFAILVRKQLITGLTFGAIKE
ncbi:ABC transporter permease [Limnochorda pilosa]|uniref:ABC transporter permease n=2 Tax=Limnochorda pilosa TaxID=1555112 RepID=A0A0K2SLP7_LIMPI|nr:ABC transporter permease [Limnochorda pilosa]